MKSKLGVFRFGLQVGIASFKVLVLSSVVIVAPSSLDNYFAHWQGDIATSHSIHVYLKKYGIQIWHGGVTLKQGVDSLGEGRI